jgi:transposase
MDAEYQRLIEENRHLRAENAELQATVDRLKQRVEHLTNRVEKLSVALEEAHRAGKRQAAPFRKPRRKGKPKKPGRKPGDQYGDHTRRTAPTPDQITEHYEVPLPDSCENCHSEDIEPDHTVVQYQVEIPQKPIYRQFTIATGRCRHCGKAIQGRHALQTSDAIGAAGVQLGPRAHAAMAWMHKRLGLSLGKVRQMFEEMYGIAISRSTTARSCRRTARRCAAAHEQIRQDVRSSPQVVPDETGWRVGGEKAWLHEFAGLHEVAYVVDPTRSREPAERLLGLDWSGRLVHDGWSPYDAFTRAIHQQCNAHLINRCKKLLETATTGAARFPAAVKTLLLRGLALRDRSRAGNIGKRGLAVMAGRLTHELLCLVGARKFNPANERLASHLFAYHESIFNYLRHPGMDATNWRGEQAIRFGVVNRKVWGGNRTWPGAAVQSTLMSVIQTCIMRSLSPICFLINSLTATKPILVPAWGR